MATRIQLRRGTAAQWTNANPVLASGEPAVETDTGKRKIGDGVTAWADLPYDLTKAEADDLYATIDALVPLTPGLGEVIVGGASGPEAVPYEPGGGGGGIDPAILLPFHAALADRDTSPVDIVAIGDSITEGWGATTRDKRWVARLRDKLRAAQPVPGVEGGEGYMSAGVRSDITFDDGWAHAGGTAHASALFGLGRRSWRLTSGGQSLTATFTGTSFDLVYTQGTNGALLNIVIDGGDPVPVPTDGSLVVGARWRSPTLSAGEHIVTIQWVSGGDGHIEGIMVYDGDEGRGIRMWEGGRTGSRSNIFLVDSPVTTYWQGVLASIQPSLVLVSLGTNDWMYNTGGSSPYGYYPPAETRANLENIIAGIREQVANDPTIVLVAVHHRGDNPPSGQSFLNPWDDYVLAMHDLASADGKVAVIDMTARLGPSPWSDTNLLMPDKIHLNDAGNEFYASAIAGALMPR